MMSVRCFVAVALLAVADAKLFQRQEPEKHNDLPTAKYTHEWKCRHQDGSYEITDHDICHGKNKAGCEFVDTSCRQVPKMAENNSDAGFLCKQHNASDDSSEFTEGYQDDPEEALYDHDLCDTRVYGDLCEWGAIECRPRPKKDLELWALHETYPEETDAADDVENHEGALGDVAPEQGAGDDRRAKKKSAKKLTKAKLSKKAAKKRSKKL